MSDYFASDASDEDWDAFLGSHPQGHHEQSSEYAGNRAEYGFQCDRVAIRDGQRIVGGFQTLVQNTPIGKLALILRGPLAEDDNTAVLNCAVRELDRLAERRSYASVRVDTFPTQTASRQALEAAGFQASTAWHGTMRSLLVPVLFSNEELVARMKPNGRRDVRFAERAGVTVHVGDESSLDTFMALHDATAAHQGFPIFKREYFETVWRIFGGERRAPLFLAYYDNKPIAAILNLVVGGRLYYTWGGMDRNDAVRKLNANCLLHLFAMSWAREHGCTHYDLSGVSGFKEKLGRDEIDWPLPRRKFYGPLRDIRRALTDTAWTSPAAQRMVNAVAYRLNLSQRMPY
jgi:lipid II:glycine glycyltransferase (peptidoglycan interpeptide bridge formation enzyme)